MEGAAGADEDAVEVLLVEHAIDVVVEGDAGEVVGEGGAELAFARIDDGDDFGAGVEAIDDLQHVPHSATVTDHAEAAHTSSFRLIASTTIVLFAPLRGRGGPCALPVC